MSTSRALPALLLLTNCAFSMPVVPSISTSTLLVKDSPALELSQAPILSLPTSDVFPIPETDLILWLHQFGPSIDHTDLSSFLIEASSDIKNQIDCSSVKATSSERLHIHRSDGLVLEILSRSISLKKYISLGELRAIINGLSLYMMQGTLSRAVQFQVIRNPGATKAVIINTGSIRQDMALPGSRVKRGISPLRLVQFNSSSTGTGLANDSTPSLLLADESEDFPIPYTHYSLRFGNLGSYLHPWDLETLLIAVRAEIKEEIAAHGRTARLPSIEYSKDLGGLQLWLQIMPWDTVNLAWAELAIIVEGLWLYIVDGRHDRETLIDVINNSIVRQVAFGWIGKPHRPLEHTSSTAGSRRGLVARAPRQIS